MSVELFYVYEDIFNFKIQSEVQVPPLSMMYKLSAVRFSDNDSGLGIHFKL